MQMTCNLARRVCLSLVCVCVSAPAWAAPASDTLLPRGVKGYVSVTDAKQFDERWDKTQLGQLFNDDSMQSFVADARKQLVDEFGAVERKLGITWDDLKGVTGGELSLSLIERKNGPEAALAITINVTGHEKEAERFIAAAEKRFAARGGRKSTVAAGDTTLRVYDVPADKGHQRQQTVYFIKDNVLCGIDDLAEAQALVRRFGGGANDNLASVVAYQQVMARCQKEAGDLKPEARWFVEPFGFVFAQRTLRDTERRRDQDLVKILFDNGFDAIVGAGGHLNQLVDGHIEYLLRTAIYAPPVKGKENDPLRWTSSMRMMQFINAAPVEPQSWVPRMVANYMSVNIDLAAAFDNLGPLFDAIQEHEDAWKNTLEGWANDQYGPQVDVRKEFIENLNNRVSVITSYDTPITPESERSLFAIEAKNEAALAKTLDKWMKNERDIVRHEVANGQFVIYERTRKANVVEQPEIEVPGFSKSTKNANPKKERERVLPNSAVTVALGHLMLASDINYLTAVLEGFGQNDRLASSADYRQLVDVLAKLAPGEQCAWGFGRGDEEVRPMFELIRQNRMPESKSMMGKLLNNLLTTDADRKAGTPRKQQVDGANLPDFESVRRYFGPHARAVRADKDGWVITEAVMNTEAP